MVDDEAAGSGERERVSPGAPEQGQSDGELQKHVPAEIRNPSFAVSVRGYGRQEVDAYVNRVNRVIAELEVGASPRAAVRHALEQAGQQISGLLEQARETAETIIASGRQEAEENIARAKAEAADLVANASSEADNVRAEAEKLIADARREADEICTRATAEVEETRARARTDEEQRRHRLEEELAALHDDAETRLRELRNDTEAVANGRRQLVEDIHGLARALAKLAGTAAAQFPPAKGAEAEDNTPEREVRTAAEAASPAASEHAPETATARSGEGGGDTPSENKLE